MSKIGYLDKALRKLKNSYTNSICHLKDKKFFGKYEWKRDGLEFVEEIEISAIIQVYCLNEVPHKVEHRYGSKEYLFIIFAKEDPVQNLGGDEFCPIKKNVKK